MRDNTLRIVVVGDAGVGKSSLIHSVLNDEFPTDVAAVLPESRVQGEPMLEDQVLVIADTPADPEKALPQVEGASVVLVVHSPDVEGSFERLASFWIPEVAKRCDKPIFLVGAKMDLRDSEEASSDVQSRTMDLQARMEPIMQEHESVEACMECSARTLHGVADVFATATRLVMYPMRPLFDVKAMRITSRYRNALDRVFRVFDEDNDGLLSEDEVCKFQAVCFDVHLTPEDLVGLRQVLEDRAPGCVVGKSIDFEGFVYLNREFILRNKADTNWRVLQRFGYDHALRFTVQEHHWRLPHRAANQSYELSPAGEEYLRQVFRLFANDNRALGERELSSVFRPCRQFKARGRSSAARRSDGEAQARRGHPFGPEFPATTLTNASGEVTMQGWIAQWSMLALIDVRECMRYLHILGFGGAEGEAPTSAIRIRGRTDKELASVKTFRVFVFGARGTGKSSLLEALVNRAFRHEYVPTDGPHSVVGVVEPRDAEEPRYLVMTEWPEESADEALEAVSSCDLAVLCYDATTRATFDTVLQLQKRLSRSLAQVFVALKTELHEQAHREGQPQAAEYDALKADVTEHMQHYNLPENLGASVATEKPSSLFRLLAEACMHPDVARPVTDAERRVEEQYESMRRAAVVAGVLSIGVALAYAGYRALASRR